MRRNMCFAAVVVVSAMAMNHVNAEGVVKSRTPTEVVRHHINAMLSADARSLVEDYADDAVLVFASRVVSGKQQIKEFFDAAGARRSPAAEQPVFNIANVSGDVVIEEYTHKNADGSLVSGADVIVVRNGKIAFQATRPQPPPNTAN